MRYIQKLPNLALYLPMIDPQGSTARNYAPATKGSFNGAVTGATIGQAGKVGRSYSYDGSGDYITITHGTAINVGASATNWAVGIMFKSTTKALQTLTQKWPTGVATLATFATVRLSVCS